MSELKQLYVQSIVKWNNVRMLWEANKYEDAYHLAGSVCAFCKDTKKNSKSGIIDCDECKICKTICYNHPGKGGLVQYLIQDWHYLGYDKGLYRINTIIRMLTEEMDNV